MRLIHYWVWSSFPTGRGKTRFAFAPTLVICLFSNYGKRQSLSAYKEAGYQLTSVAKQTKDIVQCLEGVVPAFEAATIGSDDYKDKAMLVHQNVCAIAQLHPNWCDDRKIILSRQKHDAPPLDDNDPFVLIHEYSEALFRSWHQMKVPAPSVKALTHGGRVFRTALMKLREECDELTNRKACRHTAVDNDHVTVVIKLQES